MLVDESQGCKLMWKPWSGKQRSLVAKAQACFWNGVQLTALCPWAGHVKVKQEGNENITASYATSICGRRKI